MIRAVLFDLDATLVDDGQSWRSSVAAAVDVVCRGVGSPSAADVAERYYQVAGVVWEEIRGVEKPPFGNMDDERIVHRVWDETLRSFASIEPSRLEEAAAAYLSLRSSGAPAFDDTHDCLEKLQGEYRMGVVTNGASRQQVPKIESAGLAHFFEIVTTTDIGYGKPQPEMFGHALSALSTSPEEAAYVGDSRAWDVGGANRAGMTSIWLNRKGVGPRDDKPIPTYVIRTLSELPALLRGLPSD